MRRGNHFPKSSNSVRAANVVWALMHMPFSFLERSSPMWHHILVPLDGTPGAELALPLAARIARGSGATLTLPSTLTTQRTTIRRIHPATPVARVLP
jgi:hypothetical protein